ncbi:MAG TPA: hypothetical protein VHF27_00355 [Acidimicrobiales bacterium]|nr:hypothetical protein [Acidimicrobiales bacterium]
MDVQEWLSSARQQMSSQVFGEPCERDGVTLIPVASIQGGGGGGSGPKETGGGGGYGLRARPVGAFVIKGGDVMWQPAVDVNRVVVGSQLFVVVVLLLVRSMVRKRKRR